MTEFSYENIEWEIANGIIKTKRISVSLKKKKRKFPLDISLVAFGSLIFL